MQQPRSSSRTPPRTPPPPPGSAARAVPEKPLVIEATKPRFSESKWFKLGALAEDDTGYRLLLADNDAEYIEARYLDDGSEDREERSAFSLGACEPPPKRRRAGAAHGPVHDPRSRPLPGVFHRWAQAKPGDRWRRLFVPWPCGGGLQFHRQVSDDQRCCSLVASYAERPG